MNNQNSHKIIVIPGLGGDEKYIKIVTRSWRKEGLELVVHPMGWRNGEEFKTKLKSLVEFVDRLHNENSKLSVVGVSAGASAALNLFIERPDYVNKVVCVNGRLRKGNSKGLHSFSLATRASLPFAQSVELFEKREKDLNENKRSRIMTTRAMFGDELVPADTIPLAGANNITTPTLEHILSVYMTLSIFRKPIINFLIKN